MKAKLEDPNKKPEQIQKAGQLSSEMKSSGLLWTQRVPDPVKASIALGANKTEKNDTNPHEAAFLAMVQGEKPSEHEISMRNLGTVSRTKTLNECKQEIKSSFEIEFKDLGKAEIQVVQFGDTYTVKIDMLDKSRIPKNPLLFKQLIEKQLGAQFGVNFKIQVS